jgi:hypothetical protein
MTHAAARKALNKTAAKSSSAKKKVSADTKEFDEVFSALRSLLTPFEGRLSAKIDKPEYYYLETHGPAYRNRPMFFAAVRAGKLYVGYHLMPIYACPDLKKSMSPELRKRMQGKACLNFKSVDQTLFKELARITEEGFEKFTNLKYFG